MSGASDILVSGKPTITLTVTANDTFASGSRVGTGSIFTNPVTVISVSGGVGPYTYAWTTTTSNGTIATAPVSAATRFSYSFDLVPDTVTDTWICTVTDSHSTSGVSPNISIVMEST